MEEPRVVNGATSGVWLTHYRYDWRDKRRLVTMPRDGTTVATQTRTFTYNDAGLLTSQTLPENGTTSFSYNANGTLKEKIDNKGQKIEYVYDNYKRVTQIKRIMRISGIMRRRVSGF